MKICVCDIGGTNFRLGVYDNGNLYNVKRFNTPNYFNYSEEEIKNLIISEIVTAFSDIRRDNGEINCLAICFPGPVNSEGVVIGSCVVFGDALKEKFFLKKEIEKRIKGVHVFVTNDMTASVYRYVEFYSDFCLITVSSGIGNKVYSNGSVLIDEGGLTGEIGHYQTDLEDVSIECSCGYGVNHVGMISSGRGIELVGRLFADKKSKHRSFFMNSPLARSINYNINEITAQAIASSAMEGDSYCKYIIDYCTKPLADVICLLALAMNIPRFIIIGGFALNCDYYFESLSNNIFKRGIYNFEPDKIRNIVKPGIKDDDHGLIGVGKMMEIMLGNTGVTQRI